MAQVPKPLTDGALCPDCHGTGANIPATKALPTSSSDYIVCRACNGNGLDPAEYFTWGDKRAE